MDAEQHKALEYAGDEARHASEVIRGCRLVAEGVIGKTKLDTQWGVCLGILQTLANIGSHLQPNMRNCTPADASTEQLARVFLKYVEQHPERLNDGVEALAIEALKTTWPCKSR